MTASFILAKKKREGILIKDALPLLWVKSQAVSDNMLSDSSR